MSGKAVGEDGLPVDTEDTGFQSSKLDDSTV